ncbi:relaxase/mobilization nuclease domain-containing protein [Gordonia alkanivorans]|uniref:relaxase/mobilization nuclease domain-containing protein n=1 Tax=Gordonia alkanivorans TaxID=84096 RepID=UPI002449E5F0|nr:relaxase/mobilization nuclease domain-containing protein [Gordonia alkanivorans]MDH3010662.1 relaxase/mobilization nuclease domain-containing protein [Gordonia alkanivorans]MDH3015379.1 relaxase/mobilization nuclease domain-containing protein [Gordonia alkanivorans]MDH3040474.1 relaxase/mobilization nuclease domain-containing protein [Gordonia alkanivorans]
MNNPADVERVNELGRMLAEDMHSADYLVVTHVDSKGGHLHNHIYVCNNDNITGKSLQRNTSWAKGVHKANDALMEREGCQVLNSPVQAKADWSLQREQYEVDGFERTLGDKIAASLRDPRSTDREAYKAVLAEHDVKFSVAKSGEHRYKLRATRTGSSCRSLARRSPLTSARRALTRSSSTTARTRRRSGAMPLLNDMKNEDLAAQTSAENLELLRELVTRQARVEEHVAGLTATINNLIEKQGSDTRSLSGRLTMMERRQPSTPPPSSAASGIEPVRQRLDEIERTLSVLADSVSGNDLRSATKALSAETKGATSASKQAAADARKAADAAEKAAGAVDGVRAAAAKEIRVVANAVVNKAEKAMDNGEKAKAARVERLVATADKVAARRYWDALGALVLAMVPAAAILMSWTVLVGGVFYAWELVTTDGSAPELISKGLLFVLAVGAALWGLWHSLVLVYGVVSDWRRRDRI